MRMAFETFFFKEVPVVDSDGANYKQIIKNFHF